MAYILEEATDLYNFVVVVVVKPNGKTDWGDVVVDGGKISKRI
jgi:hypothetical protein